MQSQRQYIQRTIQPKKERECKGHDSPVSADSPVLPNSPNSHDLPVSPDSPVSHDSPVLSNSPDSLDSPVSPDSPVFSGNFPVIKLSCDKSQRSERSDGL